MYDRLDKGRGHGRASVLSRIKHALVIQLGLSRLLACCLFFALLLFLFKQATPSAGFRQDSSEKSLRHVQEELRSTPSTKPSSLPDDLPKRFKASFGIDGMLQACQNESPQPLDKILQNVIKNTRCSTRDTMQDFVCNLQCNRDEPELEASFRILRTSKYTFGHLWNMCRKGTVSALLWVYNNEPKVYVCGTKGRVQGRNLFKSTRSVLSMLACMVDLPDVLIALDNQDWAVPSSDPPVPGWIQPLPGVVRYTGTPSHPSVLLPTDAFIKATTHCRIGEERVASAFQVCRQIDESPEELKRPWHERKQVIFWRGSSTGVPLDPLIEEYLPRPALIHQFFNEPGFDIGFVGGKPPSSLKTYEAFFFAHKKDTIPSKGYTEYKFVLHCDGHTASWGLAHKLTTQSAIVWIPSNFAYREFFYTHLVPWEHYIPVDADLSNLRQVRDWLFSKRGSQVASQVAENARNLFETRLRPEATYCYLARLFWSLSQVQRHRATPEHLQSLGIPLDGFVEFQEFVSLKRGS